MSTGKLLMALGVLLQVGCSDYAKRPVHLKSHVLEPFGTDLVENYAFVPQNKELSHRNFIIKMKAVPSGIYLLKSQQVIKTFLLAHNSSQIIISGDGNAIKKYRDYFQQHGVRAKILLQPTINQKQVEFLFINIAKNNSKTRNKNKPIDVTKNEIPFLDNGQNNAYGYNKNDMPPVDDTQFEAQKQDQAVLKSHIESMLKARQQEVDAKIDKDKAILKRLGERSGYALRRNIIASDVFLDGKADLDRQERRQKQIQSQELKNIYQDYQIKGLKHNE